MSAAAEKEVRTYTHAPFPPDSFGGVARVAWMVRGRLVMAPPQCHDPSHPTLLAIDLLERALALARLPEHNPTGRIEQMSDPLSESLDLLGIYIRRLEDTARQYAQHLVDHPAEPKPHGGPTWKDG